MQAIREFRRRPDDLETSKKINHLRISSIRKLIFKKQLFAFLIKKELFQYPLLGHLPVCLRVHVYKLLL